MASGIIRAFDLAIRWIWAQIERFAVPIEEVVYVKAFAPSDLVQDIARRPAAHAVKFHRF